MLSISESSSLGELHEFSGGKFPTDKNGQAVTAGQTGLELLCRMSTILVGGNREDNMTATRTREEAGGLEGREEYLSDLLNNLSQFLTQISFQH